jgi:hypothetical protein
MGRRTRSLRLALAVVLVALLAGAVAGSASALQFVQGDPCADTQPLFVCPDGMVGASYSLQFKGSGGCGPGLPYQYRVLNGALPPGLSLSSSGLVSGTPTQSGTYRFWVELSDQDPPSAAWCLVAKAQREFEITVNAGISINNQTARPGTVGQPYSEQLAATLLTALPAPEGAPLATATWSVASGTLPPGIVLGQDGLLSGTPTTEGDYQFVVRAELDFLRFDTETLVISVRAPVAIAAPSPVPKSEVGVPFRLVLAASGGTGAGTYTWSLTSGSLPLGVALAADGTILGTPRAAGTFPFTATVTDSQERTAAFTGQLVVAQRLRILAGPLRLGRVGRLYRAKLRTSGGVAPFRWRVVAGKLPPGVRLDRTLGVLQGTPKKPGRTRVVIEARDAFRVVAKRGFRITVRA